MVQAAGAGAGPVPESGGGSYHPSTGGTFIRQTMRSRQPSLGPYQQQPLQPLFVPIVLCISAEDQRLMAEDLIMRRPPRGGGMRQQQAGGGGGSRAAAAAGGKQQQQQQGSDGRGGAAAAAAPRQQHPASPVKRADGSGPGPPPLDPDPDLEACLACAAVLQDYLTAYESHGLPVIPVAYGNFSGALDRLHEYILQCIQVAMECIWQA